MDQRGEFIFLARLPVFALRLRWLFAAAKL
jgi:hypothetical protein